MDFGLTHEQQMVVDTVRGFVETELYPLEADVERSGIVPRELGHEIRRKVLALGFYAPNIPAEHGGGGLDHLTFTLLERELGRASMALGVWWGRPSNILCAANEDQRQRYLLPAVRGEKMDALAMTEPDAGSDVRGMKCAARRVGGDWVLNGTKHFISHADIADFLIVFVGDGPGAASPPSWSIAARRASRSSPATAPSRIAATRIAFSSLRIAGCRTRRSLASKARDSLWPIPGCMRRGFRWRRCASAARAARSTWRCTTPRSAGSSAR